MTNTEIKIRLEKMLVRNEQRKANKLIPADILDMKDIIKQLSICDVVKSFYCDNEKQWLGQCENQCTSCYVETIRKVEQ